MAVDWTKLIPEDPSVEMIDALDEVIHDHFSGKATEITNQGVEAMVEFIRTEIGADELRGILFREYAGEDEFYFLTPPDCRYGLGRGNDWRPVSLCLAMLDEKDEAFILGAQFIKDDTPLTEEEKAELLSSLLGNSIWKDDPIGWGWTRYSMMHELPAKWASAHREFFRRRADQRLKELMASASVDALNQEV